LHLGHALENTVMDTNVRYQRMDGKKVLLLPGTDHAAVATQAKVERILMEEKGIADPRMTLGREKLLAEIRDYAEKSKKTILSQIRKMGTSCDWSRLAYTFDDKRNLAVNTVFTKMYNDGLIYRGHRVINWSVKGQSTCSDDELEYVERPAKLYTFTYAKDFPITIATTRPETKLGDTAVAVHPDDPRYQKYIGQTFTVDVGAAQPLAIRIIASADVDPAFGTGALGVTPAHSAIDFDMYEKQKALGDPIELIQVIDHNGRMTDAAGADYAGMTVEDAREKFVAWLTDNDLLEKEEDIMQNVGTSDRFKDVVEAIPMTQWFIDVNKKIPGRDQTLKELMIASVTTGLHDDTDQKITITPQRFEQTYIHWIDNLRDWCISRQVWWGHRIPVWYCSCGEMIAATTAPESCPACNGTDLSQDPDTLDTWFSSGLWTFSTLGWPQQTQDLKTFHPTAWMQMGHEILFFWMARMILMTTYTLNTIPFHDVYIHGILRDEKGNKFSKSAGNNIDPLEVIDQFGTDALRLSLISGIAPGNDAKFYEEKVIGARNFINKLWNISRFILSKSDPSHTATTLDQKDLTVFDRMILEKMRDTIHDVRMNMEHYRFAQAIETLQQFTWSDFADWYIEVAKFEENTPQKNMILLMMLEDLLALWHPFIPFVTEQIWQNMEKGTCLMITSLPEEKNYSAIVGTDDAGSVNAEIIQEVISTIRNMVKEHGLHAKGIRILIDESHRTLGTKDIITSHHDLIMQLRTGVVQIDLVSQKSDVPDNVVSHTTRHGVTIIIPLTGLIDTDAEKVKKEKELDDVQRYIKTLEHKLNNSAFVDNAPAEVVTKEREKLRVAHDHAAEITAYLDKLS
jgi:valyl-tRNA synthetase